jgi:hypothetical protein
MKTSLSIVESALKQAAQTLRSLPHKTFAGYASYWPDVVRSMPESWLAKPYQTHSRHKSTPQEISAMDEVLNWLFILTPEERRIVWARACNLSWRRMEDHDGRSHVTLRKIYIRGLTSIALALDAEMADADPTLGSRFCVHAFQPVASSRPAASPARIKVI